MIRIFVVLVFLSSYIGENPKIVVLFIFFAYKLIYPIYLTVFALVSIDEQIGHENPMRSMSFTFGESLCGVSQNVPILDTLTSP